MALYLRSNIGKTTRIHSSTVYLGGSIYTDPHDVISVRADGPELRRCVELVGITIPRDQQGATKKSVMFFGDQAKFIVANWD